jgi:hypothetical protein
MVNFHYQMRIWKFPDWYSVYQAAISEPISVLTVYSANGGYPITWNNKPYCYNDFVKRLLDNSNNRELLMFDRTGHINGMMQNGGETYWKLSTRQKEIDYKGTIATRYKLEKIVDVPKKGETIIVILRPAPIDINKQLIAVLRESKSDYLTLNAWFLAPIIRPENKYYYSLLAVKVADNPNFDWKKFFSFGGGMISGYRIVN